MPLHDSIILEIQEGALPHPLRAKDLLTADRHVIRQTANGNGNGNGNGNADYYRVGFNFYKKDYIRTQLANAAQNAGHWVNAGKAPQYKRVAKGLYEVLGLNEQEETLDQPESTQPVPTQPKPHFGQSIEARLLDHLIQTPFQILDRKRRALHPAKPAFGFKARLDAYFWPNPATNFTATEKILDSFITRARSLSPNLNHNASTVLQLLTDICKWGGVRVPTQDPQVVIDNLRLAKLRSRTQTAAMNSAWTKLYAVFYPEDFLIYDSRVATALLALAEAALSDVDIAQLRQRYPALGRVAGRGGSRPRATYLAWRNAYRCWAAQLDANALGRAMLAAVDQSGPEQYTLRHLEATLFMEGY